jgi:hypothetical protein
MPLDAAPAQPSETPTPSPCPPDIDKALRLLTEALRALQAGPQTDQSPSERPAKPDRSTWPPALKPSRPATRTASPELRARAEAARLKMLAEIATPVAPAASDDPLPLSVRIVFDELLVALQPLGGAERAAVVQYAVNELYKRYAG